MKLSDIQEIEHRDVGVYFPDMYKDFDWMVLHTALALAGEVGEVANVVKKFDRGDFGKRTLVERLRDELPDVLIYLVILSETVGVDLTKAWKDKKEKNHAKYTSGEAAETQ